MYEQCEHINEICTESEVGRNNWMNIHDNLINQLLLITIVKAHIYNYNPEHNRPT